MMKNFNCSISWIFGCVNFCCMLKDCSGSLFRTCKERKKTSLSLCLICLGKAVSIWDQVFKNGPSKVCGRQPLKNLKGYGLQTIPLQIFWRLSSTNFTWFILEYFDSHVFGIHSLYSGRINEECDLQRNT